MHFVGLALIILSAFLSFDIGQFVFFGGVALIGFEAGKRFACWDWKRL